ncbi:oligopeptide/dipeptide ABC transporter ATP-binding protein [Marinomonas arenicola]|uniref:oligopeptide/dipeptide ABC transporter ATP-binding protein n=1 Tax=Marinomonas arenicola TaxID=569601 RepID=UPI00311D3F3A
MAGNPPNLLNLPTGCPFQERCQHAEDLCRKEAPTLEEYQAGKLRACHKPIHWEQAV